MQIISILSLLLPLAVTVSARHEIGEQCSGSGYDCTATSNEIVVCNGYQWQLAAKCGNGCCVWPGTPAPYCAC
ncbi:hypothetical protein BDV23DRAFT_164146 [Aspergillus alliaceus]|uniref:Uncharacterized protein n=1 Tax=Petromyces alliaceus TaxID=209559 RepID=A0A5N6FGD8_PETAA|nr:uncharacterized protein BDW43DRAFT_289635 [Aspergillus alliaceus]KAB8229026.1 hypothetical protein BDW43DRAFT_289635 [Aspergillus alliaceus]KAE8385880.1 hypothetical protein BDV23DRAFT_164146 [Aspergillus alliaceus]